MGNGRPGWVNQTMTPSGVEQAKESWGEFTGIT